MQALPQDHQERTAWSQTGAARASVRRNSRGRPADYLATLSTGNRDQTQPRSAAATGTDQEDASDNTQEQQDADPVAVFTKHLSTDASQRNLLELAFLALYVGSLLNVVGDSRFQAFMSVLRPLIDARLPESATPDSTDAELLTLLIARRRFSGAGLSDDSDALSGAMASTPSNNEKPTSSPLPCGVPHTS